MPRSSVFATLSLATTLTAAASGQNVISARPGTISYIEGQASLGTHAGGKSLNNSLAGTLSLGAGETLETTAGRAEVQLTPGIFLRVGQNSVVKMVSPSLIHTVVEVQRGKAEVEVDQLFEQNDVRVSLGIGPGGAETQVMKPGLYEFDADAGLVRVFEGKAEVSRGASSEKPIGVKGGHLLALNGDTRKPQGFNKKKSTDELTEWSELRSQYAGQENAGMVQSGGGYGNGFAGGGYDLGFGSYPWFPGGAGFSSPYGLGLSSSLYGSPFGFAGYGYPGFGYSGFGYPGYGFYGGSGYGFAGGGYGGGSGYSIGSRPSGGLGYRNGYSGQLGNRGGTNRPTPAPVGAQGPIGGLHGVPRGNGGGGASSTRGAAPSNPGSFGGAAGGGASRSGGMSSGGMGGGSHSTGGGASHR